MRYVLAALAVTMMMIGAAQAQQGAAAQMAQRAKSPQSNDSDDKQKPKANDKAYSAALKTLPDKQFDPWRGVR